MKTLTISLLCLLGCTTLHAQSEAEALDFVKKHHAAIHEKITALKTRAPEDYQSAIEDAIRATADHARIEAAGDKEAAAALVKMYAFDFAAITLSDQYLAAKTDSERDSLKQQLRSKIAESYDQWVIVERSRLKRLEAELQKAKTAFEDAVKSRDEVITEDTEALIEESRAFQTDKGK